MKKTILIAVALLIAIGCWYAYREYNRTSEHLKDRSPDYSVSATALIADFEKDSAAASKKYANTVIAVQGMVKSMDVDGNPVVLSLGEGSKMSSVQCVMDSAFAADYRGIREGDNVNLKGSYIGYQAEDLFGTDAKLNRCVVELKK